jgi:hypothetical protein
MKRIVLGILSLIIIMVLVACNNNNEDVMIIREREFSEETKKVLSMFEDEIVFFDYKVDESIKSMSIEIWTYENGEWIKEGAVFGNIESNNEQIAIRINDLSYDIFIINENGHTKSSYPIAVDFSNSKMTSNSRLDNPTEIEANREIPLWVRLGTNKNSMTSITLDDFRESECDTGLAITITFSDKIVE